MRKAIIVAVLFITGSVSTFAQGTLADEKTKGEVMSVAKEFANVLINRDAKAAERVLTPDYSDFSRGLPTTQFLLLRTLKEWNPAIAQPTEINFDEILTIVHVYGNTAIVNTKVNFKWQAVASKPGRLGYMWPVADSDIVTLVAVKQNGAWQIVATHASPWDVVVREVK